VGRSRLSPVIRPATSDDLAAVGAIFAWYAEHTVSTFEETGRTDREWARILVHLEDLGLPFLVAVADGDIAGYAYASPWRGKPAYRHTVEDSVFVQPGMTGRGTGRLLLAALLAGCAEGGVRQVIAIIAETGDPASAALHERLGFTMAGRLTAVGRKHDRWIDTLLYQRPIAAP
jgi:L-amino acid N-acyltransferase YncA